MNRSKILLFALSFAALGAVAGAQPAAPPKAPAAAAPAPAPQATPAPAGEPIVVGDDETPWQHFLEQYYKVYKVPKKMAVRQSDGTAWPSAYLKAPMEIVKEDEDYLYLRNLPIEDPRSSNHKSWLAHQYQQIRIEQRLQNLKGKIVIDPTAPFAPLPYTDVLELSDASKGLSDQGQWQTGLAVVDINHDGLLDLVVPPARGEHSTPHVVLQQKDGSWKQIEVQWPKEVPWDYGDVVAADFDGDGEIDLAFAIHFKSSWVVYGVKGSGGTKFDRPQELPRINGTVTSRALAVGDFNHDGRPDLAVLGELDIDMSTNLQLGNGLVTVVLNTPGGWKPVDLGAKRVFGDHLAVADFDGDGWPDVLCSKNTNGDTPFLFLNRAAGTRWVGVPPTGIPWMPYVFGVGAVRRAGRPPLAALAAMQSVRWEGSLHQVNTLLLADLTKDGSLKQTVELLRKDGVYFSALGVGDLDGDGRDDVIVGDERGNLRIFLDWGGSWVEEKCPELPAREAWISNIVVTDLDGDGRNEILVEATTAKEPGYIRVYRVARRTAPRLP